MGVNVQWRSRTMAAVLLGAVLAPGVAVGQSEPEGDIDRHIDLVVGTEGTGPHRLYVRPEVLEFGVSLMNPSRATVVTVDQDTFRRIGVRVETEGGEPVPVVMDLFDVERLPSTRPFLVPSGPGQRQIEPRQSIWWTLTLRREDFAPFAEGQYVVVFDLPSLAASIRTGAGEPWSGRTPVAGTARRRVEIRLPRNPAEEATAHRIAYSVAVSRGDWEAALQARLQAAAVEPGNVHDEYRIALTYMILGRYREAVPLLESLMVRGAMQDPFVVGHLARSYVGLRDDANAVRVLRLAGVPEGEIQHRLDTYRAEIRPAQ